MPRPTASVPKAAHRAVVSRREVTVRVWAVKVSACSPSPASAACAASASERSSAWYFLVIRTRTVSETRVITRASTTADAAEKK